MSASAPRDINRALEAFLDAGPDQLSSHLAHSIADEVHRTRQRAVRGPWRIPSMSRFALTTAAIAVAAVVVGLAVMLTRPAPQTGTQASPTPAQPTPGPSDFVHNTAVGELTAGQTYRASTFSTPYTFTVPPQPTGLHAGGSMKGDALDATHAMRLQPGQGALVFQDGVGLPSDLCHPDKGLLTTLPATPQGVGDWLAATKGLTISRLPNITVDGRTALSWDIALAASCYSGLGAFSDGQPVVWFEAGEHHRLYAVPTGNGTILLSTWGAGYQGQGENVLPAVNVWSDALVRTLRFG
jgi:hypothetical protein